MTDILLVEDDSIVAKAFCRVLHGSGYRVRVVTTCEAARLIVFAADFALIFVDFMLPDGDGMELTRWLRTVSSTPVIMCTSSEDEETFAKAFEAGVSDFIRKPWRPTELLVRTANAIRLAEAGLKQLEAQQARSLFDITSLVAHEINNPLCAGYHYCGSLAEQLPGDERLTRLTQGLDRIGSLVSDLRKVALIQESAVSEVHLSEICRLVVRLLGVRNSGRLSIRQEVEQDASVLAHPGVVSQAVVALCRYLLDRAEHCSAAGLLLKVGPRGCLCLELVEPQTNGLAGPEPPEVLLARRQLSVYRAEVYLHQGVLLTIRFPIG